MCTDSGGRSPGRGFTLVELLVVIGIVAVLIAILLPALSKAQSQSRTVACLSNLRQLDASLIMYVNDNKGHVFPYFDDPDTFYASGQSLWMVDLARYGTGSKQILCPEANQRNPALDTPGTTQWGTNAYCWGPHGRSIGEYKDAGGKYHDGWMGSYAM